MSEASSIPLMTQHGQEVLRDLCHVAKLVSLRELEQMKLGADTANKGAVFLYVSLGTWNLISHIARV
jgi:hypothetical protein